MTWEYHLLFFKIYCKHCGKIFMEVRYGRMNAGENSEMACILRFCEDQLKWHHIAKPDLSFRPPCACCGLRYEQVAQICAVNRAGDFFSPSPLEERLVLSAVRMSWQNSRIAWYPVLNFQALELAQDTESFLVYVALNVCPVECTATFVMQI